VSFTSRYRGASCYVGKGSEPPGKGSLILSRTDRSASGPVWSYLKKGAEVVQLLSNPEGAHDKQLSRTKRNGKSTRKAHRSRIVAGGEGGQWKALAEEEGRRGAAIPTTKRRRPWWSQVVALRGGECEILANTGKQLGGEATAFETFKLGGGDTKQYGGHGSSKDTLIKIRTKKKKNQGCSAP